MARRRHWRILDPQTGSETLAANCSKGDGGIVQGGGGGTMMMTLFLLARPLKQTAEQLANLFSHG